MTVEKLIYTFYLTNPPELWEAVQKINQAAKQISANNTPPQTSLFTGKFSVSSANLRCFPLFP